MIGTGTGYETVLLIGELPVLAGRLTVDGWLVPVGPGRTAVLPREPDVDEIARDAGVPALTNEVFDSGLILMRVYRDGRRRHEYVSDRAAWTDPAMFGPFAVGPVNMSRLGAALRGEFFGRGPRFAEFQHRLILKALNLEPRPLTTAFRWARAEDLPGAVRIPA
jgi:hypothetical protein